MSGLNHIGLSLTIVFAISLVLLLAELSYVLWRRRVFHRQGRRQVQVADSNSQAFSEASSTCLPFSFYSKELLYFYFCTNGSRISRLEPNSAPTSLDSGQSCPDDETVEVIDVFKLQNMYGPPRFLFTIKEEEREIDSEWEYYSDKEKPDDENGKNDSKRSVKLEECLKVTGESVGTELEHAIKMDGEDAIDEAETTPFSTPCDSPLYFTPSASPIHQPQITES